MFWLRYKKLIFCYTNIIGLRHEISNNVVCATSKTSDQPAHMRSLIRAFVSRLNILLTEHHLEFLSLKGDCAGSPESALVKMPHCWKSHVMAHIFSSTASLSRSMLNKSFDEIELPPEPLAKCNKKLQVSNVCLCPPGKLSCFFVICLLFFKINFFEKLISVILYLCPMKMHRLQK